MDEKKRGRKSVYEEKIKPNLQLIKAWKREGIEDKDIIEALGISKTPFYKYAKEKEEFREVLKKGKQECKAEIENILYEEATVNRKQWAIEKILNRFPEWSITPKDEIYFGFKDREIKAKEKENEIEEQRITKIIGDDPDE